MASSLTQTMWITMEEETRKMMTVWPDIIRDVTEHVRNLSIPDIDKWLEKVLQYNVSGTKKLHSLTLIYAYKSIASNEQQTENNIRLVRILAWCMEMALAYLVMIDDIMDQSLFRRGKPCWYRHDNIGLMAINDGLLLESTVYFLIQKHFKEKECYRNLVETFQQALFNGLIGQFLDMSSVVKKSNLDQFTMNRYNSTVVYKSSQLGFLIPAVLAMHFIGIKNPEMFKQSETILLKLGHLYPVQDDCLGCFFDVVLRKDSTDIIEGKCTWIIVKALERVTPEQRKILEECYGVSDPEKVRRVKQLYIDLDLQNAFYKYEEETYNAMNALIYTAYT